MSRKMDRVPAVGRQRLAGEHNEITFLRYYISSSPFFSEDVQYYISSLISLAIIFRYPHNSNGNHKISQLVNFTICKKKKKIVTRYACPIFVLQTRLKPLYFLVNISYVEMILPSNLQNEQVGFRQ